MALEKVVNGTIYQGTDKDLKVSISYELPDGRRGDPVDLTNATEVIVLLPKADGSPLIKKQSDGQITPIRAAAGIFKVHLSAADTKLLKLGEALNIEVRFVIDGEQSIVQLESAVTIAASYFPNANV